MKKQIFALTVFAVLPLSAFLQTKTVDYQEIVVGKGVFFGAVMDELTSTITMTISGPDDRWFGVGFGSGMSNGDLLIYTDGKTGAFHTLEPTDYKMTAQNAGGVNKDASQDWTILSNTETGGLRTIVASRDLNTGDAQDNVLDFSSANVSVVWAKHGSASHSLAYHGNQNRGVKSFTWTDDTAGLVETEESQFDISLSSNAIQITDKSGKSYEVKVTNLNGQLMLSENNISGDYTIQKETLDSGTYVIVILTEGGVISKVIRL